ncbi:hypothetical protein GJV06_15105 [Enterobacteriaceae bacterium RIT691]|nr:hypothetical protein [Enterobacteriaceae bacterium RIT691]
MKTLNLLFAISLLSLLTACSSSESSKRTACNEAAQNLDSLSTGTDKGSFDEGFEKLKATCHSQIPESNVEKSILSFFSKSNDYDKASEYTIAWYKAQGIAYMQNSQALSLLEVVNKKAIYEKPKNPTAAQKSFMDFEKSLSNYQLSRDEYYSLIETSLTYRYLMGERSQELVLEYKAYLNSDNQLFRDEVHALPTYDMAIGMAKQIGDKKSASEMEKQRETLNGAANKMRQQYPYVQGEDGVPEQYYQKQILRIGIISKYLSEHGEDKLAETWKQRVPVLQQETVETARSRAIAENAAAQTAQNESNSTLSTQILEVISAGVIAQAAGGNTTAAINNGLANMVASNSDNPEMMSAAQSGLTSIAQSSGNSSSANNVSMVSSVPSQTSAAKCDRSTVASFQHCCLAIRHGSISTYQNKDGTVDYGCTGPAPYHDKESCTYSGTTLVGGLSACRVQ